VSDDQGPAPGRRRPSLWERLVPHWQLVVTLAVAAALALWWASYGVAW
jgi:hypothetical protein